VKSFDGSVRRAAVRRLDEAVGLMMSAGEVALHKTAFTQLVEAAWSRPRFVSVREVDRALESANTINDVRFARRTTS
jgi:hypothetical protein